MLSASFHIPEQGPEHHAPMPDVPEPDSLQSLLNRRRDATDLSPTPWLRPRAVDLRYVGSPSWEAKLEPRPDDTPRRSECLVWMRAGERLPDDPLIHVCAVTYASDMTLLDAVLLRHGLAWQARVVTGASPDHAMWFHAPFRADEWLLYLQRSPAASDARGLALGRIYRRDGRLVASVVQEGLIRVSPDD